MIMTTKKIRRLENFRGVFDCSLTKFFYRVIITIKKCGDCIDDYY